MSWNARSVSWACCRNFGKSFLIAIIAILQAVLYEDQNIYIISSVGAQAKETFTKMEEIITNSGQAASSVQGLKDIVIKEIKKSATSKNGFKHDPASYVVEFYNGSKIFTLNAKPDNIRGKRANLVIYDEAAFCSEDLIVTTEPFTTQDAEFKTNVDGGYNPELNPLTKPNKLIYASTQNTVDALFYLRYKEAAKRMIAGDKNYFACDMPCDTAIEVYVDGIKYPSLLQRSVVDQALKDNKEKGLREYYNKPTLDFGEDQIIKWNSIRSAEKDIIPYCEYRPDNNIVLAFDPARTGDNSILSGMNIYEDPETGFNGDIILCRNMIDTKSKKKFKLDSNTQVREIRKVLQKYSGTDTSYSHIDSLLIDSGSGGGGMSAYADNLLQSWTDKNGIEWNGVIDKRNDVYATLLKSYPKAVDKVRLISPVKFRTQMIIEFIELMKLGVIHFPREFKHPEIKNVQLDEKGEELIVTYELSKDEIINIQQIDLMKLEITSIHKKSNSDNTSVTYSLSKEKQNRMHDDRFYTIILLAHRLYELRRGKILGNRRGNGTRLSSITQIRKPKITN